MQWSEEEFLKWVREHPTVEDLMSVVRDFETGGDLI